MAVDNTDYQEREAKAVAAIKEAIPEEFKQNLVPKSKGLFTELYALDLLFPDHYIATTVDGMGSKLILATVLGEYDIEADIVGKVRESSGTPTTVLHKGGKELSFAGYG